jgi:glucosamine--fructose-6-phosphate aminotransferase (isomerizing)
LSVVVPDEHAHRVCDEPVGGPDLVHEPEALRADIRAAASDLDLLTRMQLGTEIDLDSCQDERLQPAEDADSCLLEVRRVHGVVGVAHGVAIAEADVLVLHPGERRARLAHPRDGIEAAMPGETKRAVEAQPDWLRQVPTGRRLPEGARVVHTGCGTSFHAAQTGGRAVQALEAVLDPPHADVMVAISHEGGTALTLEAVRAFPGETWLVTGNPSSSALAAAADEVVVATPELERSWCHTASYTCAVAALDALHGRDIAWLPDAVEAALQLEVSAGLPDRVLVAGAGRNWPTAQEAVLKLREGARVGAEAFETEQLLHGYLAAVEPGTRAFVLEGDGIAAERAHELARVLGLLGVDVTVLPTRHPVVDIVYFQLLTLAEAAARGVDPDAIRREPGSPLAHATGEAYAY